MNSPVAFVMAKATIEASGWERALMAAEKVKEHAMNPQREIPIGSDTFATAKWVWQNLVPKSGQAETVQGELLRAVEKLRWEAQTNGNANWDEGFEAFLKYLDQTLCADSGLSESAKQSIRTDLAILQDFDCPYTDDDLYERLTEHVIEYCRQHPQVIDRPRNPHLRR